MNDQQADVLARFDENRRQVPAEYLRGYWGKQVAWNAEGTQIVASGDTHEEVLGQLRAAGILLSQVVLDYVDDPNIVQL
jgi:hypothetical protein